MNPLVAAPGNPTLFDEQAITATIEDEMDATVSTEIAPPDECGRLQSTPAEAGDLKRKTARGALVSVAAQGASFALRTGSMVILARLLTPADFGLVGMVTAFTGFLG